jgi:hypothetical protein
MYRVKNLFLCSKRGIVMKRTNRLVHPVFFKRKTTFLFLLILGVVLISLSCSRAEPRIAFGGLRLVYYQDQDRRREQFSFFVLPDDDDGIEDLAELYLYHDREGLVWLLTADDWIAIELEGDTWIGSHSITMMDNEILPRGQYRAVLVDKGGERSERLFTFDAPEDERYPFPFLIIEDGRYRIDSRYPVHSFICYDVEGAFLATIPLNTLDGPLNDLSLPANTRTVALWAEDPEYYSSAITDIVPIR